MPTVGKKIIVLGCSGSGKSTFSKKLAGIFREDTWILVHRLQQNLMFTVFTLVLGYNLKVAVGTSTMIMSIVALTGAVSHITMGAKMNPLPAAVTILSCLFGAFVSARFANRCEIRKLNKVVGVVLTILGIVTIAIKIVTP